MTEYEAPVLPKKPRRSWRAAILFLLFVAVVTALAYGGWRLWQARERTEDTVAAQDVLLRRMTRQLGETQAEVQQLRDRQTDILETTKRTVDDLAALQGRIAEADATVAKINTAIQGGHGRAQLVAIEQLLLIANERVQLAHDAHGAIEALSLAQDRIGALTEPKLFDIREALAQERAALQAVPQVDLEAAALTVSGLIRIAPRLPQRSRAPHAMPVSEAAADVGEGEAGSGWLARGWANLRQVAASIFPIRRTDKPVDRLLPADQEGLVGQLLLLKLETARAALLSGNTEALQGSVNDAGVFLDDYYRTNDSAVIAAKAEMDRLRTFDLSPKLPDLSRGLDLLRAYLDANAR